MQMMRESRHDDERNPIGKIKYLIVATSIVVFLVARFVCERSSVKWSRELNVLNAHTRVLHVGCPEGEVVAQQLHNEGRVLVALFREGVEFGDGIIESLLGEMASTVGRVKDLVIEDGEVEGKTEADGVRRWEFGDGNIGSSLVSFEGLVRRFLSLVAGGELGEVTVVVTLHLVVENFRFASGGGGDKVLVKDLEDILADLCELRFNLLPVALDHGDLRFISL